MNFKSLNDSVTVESSRNGLFQTLMIQSKGFVSGCVCVCGGGGGGRGGQIWMIKECRFDLLYNNAFSVFSRSDSYIRVHNTYFFIIK